MQTTGTGTGNLTVAAVNGKQAFGTAFGTGVSTNVFDYFISNQSAAEWERGTGHMSNSTTLVRDTVIESTNANAAVNFSAGTKDVTNDIPALLQARGPGSSTDGNLALWNGTGGALLKDAGYRAREVLSSARTYYVGFNIPTPTISIATPAVVTSTAHGLSVGDPVVFNVPLNTRTFTVTIASPGVFTLNSHGFAAGQPVVFQTTGALPTGLTAGTTYYVIAAGLTTNAFEVSTTVGGAAVNTSGTQSGTHYCSQTGALPTGITEGTTYYVITAGLTANAFEISATPGGSAVNTSGSVTGTPLYSAYTGNDSNTGLAQTRAAAFLTIQKAFNTCLAIDFNTNAVTIQCANGTFTAGLAMSAGWLGGTLTIQGNATTPSNCLVSPTSADCFKNTAVLPGALTIQGFKIQTTTSGHGIHMQAAGAISVASMEFGTLGSTFQAHLFAEGPGTSITATSAYLISGSPGAHVYATECGRVTTANQTVSIVGVPAFSDTFCSAARSAVYMAQSMTFNGSATGKRFDASNLGLIFNAGAGSTYFPGGTAGTGTTPGTSPYGLII